MSELPILIAGGGIGGLAAALALAKIGRSVEVLERSPRFTTAGAGIQLGPNAVKILRQLGVADAVREQACQPTCLAIYSGGNDRSIAQMPLGTTIAERCGAPYWTIHRADLLQVLADAASHSPLISLSLGCHVSQVVQTANGVTVTLADGTAKQGQALIGADGIWSRVREVLEPSFLPAHSGYCAYRTVMPLELAGDLPTDVVAAWLSPSVHVVHYPVQADSALNIVVVVRDSWNATGWDAPADPAAVIAASAPFPQRLRAAIAAAPQWHKWSLPRPVVQSTWVKGDIALVGDAAHAMLPFLAQGGVMALEDAAALAAAVAINPNNLSVAFNDYQAGRRERVARVQTASVENGRVFHLSGPMAFARDTVLRVTPAAAMLARFDWLYGYEVSNA